MAIRQTSGSERDAFEIVGMEGDAVVIFMRS